jgi:LAO/AO transport system kinase
MEANYSLNLTVAAGARLVEDALAGNRLSLARLLTQVENGTPEGQRALDKLFPYAGRAHLIGVTGSPGTGKSSLVNRIAQVYRDPRQMNPPRSVGVVAIDPSSPFTGGALLGDRVRMRDLAGDPGVFIRSMASRGALGGLARQTASIVQVLDAVGFEIILIETVGAGQSEVDIARLAYTTLVVEAPGLGDEIQAIKAGILEIADILVINKADRPGVENTERALRGMLEMGHARLSRWGRKSPTEIASVEEWVPPVHKTVATEGRGSIELVQSITRHLAYLQRSGEWQRRQYERLQNELDGLIQMSLVERWRSKVSEDNYDEVLEQLCERKISPYQAVKHLLSEI